MPRNKIKAVSKIYHREITKVRNQACADFSEFWIEVYLQQ
jgi:hypothetical protein